MLWHASRSEINSGLMLEDLKNEDWSSIILGRSTLRPGCQAHIQLGMSLSDAFDPSVPQFPKLSHGDNYRADLIVGWEV